jgi:hypothetical protein
MAILQADVFPTIPGAELVVAHQLAGRTHTLLRIYQPFAKDRETEPLYSVWLEAQITSMYWISGPGLLVVAGANGKSYWPERGYPRFKMHHPRIVFALHPELGFRAEDYLAEKPGTGPLSPVWNRLIGPPEAHDIHDKLQLLQPYGPAPPSRSVALNVRLMPETVNAGVEFVIDEHGVEVPGTRRTDDEYKLNQDRLPPVDFILQDLPPAKPTSPKTPKGRVRRLLIGRRFPSVLPTAFSAARRLRYNPL